MIATRHYRAVGAILALTFSTADISDGQQLSRQLRTTAENDFFNFWVSPYERPDDNYTQGLRLEWDDRRVPSFARRLICRAKAACGSTLEVGQEIYTPTDDATGSPAPGERPYAGWLYVKAAAVGATIRTRRDVGVTIGVTGRASLAQQTQESYHRLIDYRPPLGWSYQLPTEPSVAVHAEESWLFAAPSRGRPSVDLVPWANATVGTLRTALSAGARARVGPGLRHPWLVDERASSWETYLFLGAGARAVAHDLFLDGTTFRPSVRAERVPFVPSWDAGVSVRYRRLGFEYRVATEGRAYRGGPSSHSYSGLSAAWWIAR
ncbi:MAG: lipid A deacylase LpxR family protein [Gemmatimonadaceae bacterium]